MGFLNVSYKDISLPIMEPYTPMLGQKNLRLSGRNVVMDPPPGVPTVILKSTPQSILSIYSLNPLASPTLMFSENAVIVSGLVSPLTETNCFEIGRASCRESE